jgi:hydroxyacylglutathione hydrolase
LQGYFSSDVCNESAELEKTLSVNTAQMLQLASKQEAVVLDVRGSNERAAGHIPGTRHIPLGYLQDHLDELPRDRPIAVHCQSGSRAAIAASVLQAAGFEQVLSVKGGYAEWLKGPAQPR